MDIEEIRRLREEYETALDHAEARRSAYHQAIRKLYMSGVPLRDLADQLGMSHQRVHQIVGQEPPARKRRRLVGGAAVSAVVLLMGVAVWAIVRGGGDPPRGVVSGEGPVAEPKVNVRVSVFDRSWRFDYEGEGVTVEGSPGRPLEMVIPAGRAVALTLISRDVIHSFYVPQLSFKRDIIPGRANRTSLHVARPGR